MVFSRFLWTTIFIPAENTQHSKKHGQHSKKHGQNSETKCKVMHSEWKRCPMHGFYAENGKINSLKRYFEKKPRFLGSVPDTGSRLLWSTVNQGQKLSQVISHRQLQ
jgi:hypothetical protein